MMMRISGAKTVTFLAILGLIIAGCAPQAGMTARQYDENWRFVPRIHVEDNSFGVTSGVEYRGCSYDTYYEGYFCPVNR
ncbi:MAG TPA: hypothetical protein VJ988_04180 [Desulfobulbales bacterium]|jgi:hypothetical protein|nr:hypothetical protein [Desulfobulbales bacterium]